MILDRIGNLVGRSHNDPDMMSVIKQLRHKQSAGRPGCANDKSCHIFWNDVCADTFILGPDPA